MRSRCCTSFFVLSLIVSLSASGVVAQGTQTPAKPFEPQVGQPGKDVVWVPTPQPVVDKMLDLTKVTAQDVVIDLGSGDGVTVITAAKRGARAMGIEYNPDMVELATQRAAAAGVSNRATFVKADLFETDLSKATVITMFLLPSINMTLRPKILDLKPGTRVASNTFTMEDWDPDQSETISGDCTSWCTALMWIVPAKVDGEWRMTPAGTLTIAQKFQNFDGTLGTTKFTDGKLRGADITFKIGAQTYSGRVDGNSMKGTITGGSGGTWSATHR